jgi:hypothetical protein
LGTSESETLAVSHDSTGWAFEDEVLDAHVAFLLVAWSAFLQDAGVVLQLEAFSAGNALARMGLVVVGPELFVSAADLVALAVDELVTFVAADSDADVLSGLGIEAEFAVGAALDGNAVAVDVGFADSAVGLANTISEGLAFSASESDAFADD